MEELTRSVNASFKGAVLNKVASGGQEQILSKKLSDKNVPILGTIHHHDGIVAACLEGDSIDVPAAASEMEGIVKKLLT